MKPFRVPLAVPETQRVMMTQGFGVTSVPLEPEGPNGEPHFHYGIDLVCGDDHHTYGLAVVCPFESATVEDKTWQGAMNNAGNGIIAAWTDPQGDKYEAIMWHLSAISDPTTYAQGEVMGRVGNTGLVFPAPALQDPYRGAHLHLGLKLNGEFVDPAQYFDITNPYPGEPTPPALEMPPARWVIAKLAQFMQPFIPASEYDALLNASKP